MAGEVWPEPMHGRMAKCVPLTVADTRGGGAMSTSLQHHGQGGGSSSQCSGRSFALYLSGTWDAIQPMDLLGRRKQGQTRAQVTAEGGSILLSPLPDGLMGQCQTGPNPRPPELIGAQSNWHLRNQRIRGGEDGAGGVRRRRRVPFAERTTQGMGHLEA